MKNIFYKKTERVSRFLFLNENLEGEDPILTSEQVEEVLVGTGNTEDFLMRLNKSKTIFEEKIREIGDLLDSYHEFKEEHNFANKEDIPKQFFGISANAQTAENLEIKKPSVDEILGHHIFLKDELKKIEYQINFLTRED